ncbi:Rubrerythrin family protein [Trichomonas vaginalis G3]|uniref:Rubrerythrin family protein n=1 Tax=Trichomonas vaginalis (strain ATCC PRA-98 / G3) TaxID=412133 RepID=A2FWG0_TRIV3|nr:rubrerythrin family [Trichomonas vaginalis G3]EAX90759.1 Rubrerythrin family protein [Trichomonas vaginalis G3]KAI5515826.1 rubrerythrin family [Trichomonas vaginalis G3]|eukprot:XP_001303689.1 Rubrerythrin family protein [Trichomonas vaginalis G3]
MSIPFKGSQTEKNVAAAYVGEYVAYVRYQSCAKKARKEGFEQNADYFLETGENEREHGNIFLKMLTDSDPVINVPFPIETCQIKSTLENLKISAAGEENTGLKVYPYMAAIAEKEGFVEIANTFKLIAEVEHEHGVRLATLAKQVENGTFWKREKEVEWKCRNCGYIFKGKEAPKECPVCHHPQSFQQIREVLE